jgi:hypothetical protein
MTLTVKPNKNGTITISCGDESITIAAPVPAGDPEPQRGPFSYRPVVLPRNDAAAASIVADGKAKTEVVIVASEDDLLREIRERYGRGAPEPTILQFYLGTDEFLNVGKINKAFADSGNPDWAGIQIMPGGVGDE